MTNFELKKIRRKYTITSAIFFPFWILTLCSCGFFLVFVFFGGAVLVGSKENPSEIGGIISIVSFLIFMFVTGGYVSKYERILMENGVKIREGAFQFSPNYFI